MSRVPSSLNLSDVQQSFRELAAQVDKLTTGNIDLTGRRVINAGGAQGGQDYITKAQLDASVARVAAANGAPVPPATPVIVGTHSARLAHVPSPEGLLFYETDRTVFYVVAGGAWLYATGIMVTAPGDITVVDVAGGPTPPGDPIIPPTDDGGINTDLTVAHPSGVPSSPNLRFFRGDMWGVTTPGIAAVTGGGANAAMALSWFYDRYSSGDRATIRAGHSSRTYTHFKLSWPDSRNYGTSVTDYVNFALELKAAGFYVGHFLSSKDWDPADAGMILANLASSGVLAALIAAGAIDWACVGWELSLWLSPTDVQTLIDSLSGTLSGIPLYVHFQEDYTSFQLDGHITGDFWRANQGKLTGLLHQRKLTLTSDCAAAGLNIDECYQARVADGLTRFAGNFLTPNDSGFGHPFDYICYEVRGSDEFNGTATEAQGCATGTVGVLTAAQVYAGTTVGTFGFGNGYTPPIL